MEKSQSVKKKKIVHDVRRLDFQINFEMRKFLDQNPKSMPEPGKANGP